MKHTIQEDWRERFDRQSKEKHFGIRSFIAKELASQLQSILEEVEGMNKQNKVHTKFDNNDDIKSYNYVNHSQNKGYNQALSDVQSIISNRMGK